MAATITVSTANATERGQKLNEINVEGSIAFDNSYPTNGESITAAAMNTALVTAGRPGITVTAIKHLMCDPQILSSVLYLGQFDSSASKLKVLKVTNAGATTEMTVTDSVELSLAVVDAETVTVSSHTGTLAKGSSVVHVTSVRGTAGLTALCRLTDTAPETKECQVDLSNGKLTFNAGDSCTQAKVTYAYKTAGSASSKVAGSDSAVTTSVAEVSNGVDLALLTFKFRAVCAL